MQNIKTIFDQTAQEYDAARPQLIPCFDDYYGTVLDVLPYEHDAPVSILDLGAGTGLLSAFVAEALPNARLTLVDVSPEMLALAKERFASQPDRFTFVEADYVETTLGGPYDAIVSALSIHHLNDEEKQRIYHHAYAALGNDGIFINADEVRGPTEAVSQQFFDAWLRRVKALGVSERDLAMALERKKQDRHSPLEIQLEWMRDSGFQDVTTWYQNFSFTVFSGRK